MTYEPSAIWINRRVCSHAARALPTIPLLCTDLMGSLQEDRTEEWRHCSQHFAGDPVRVGVLMRVRCMVRVKVSVGVSLRVTIGIRLGLVVSTLLDAPRKRSVFVVAFLKRRPLFP